MPYTKSGCYYSTPHVYPTNWENGPKSILKKVWRIDYYFFDPKFKDKYPQGKPIRVKAGINFEKTIESKRAALRMVLRDELTLLELQDYNPITKTKRAIEVKPVSNDAEITSYMPFIDALVAAKRLKKCAHNTKLDLDSVIRWVSVAAKNLGYDYLKISDIGRKHIKIILDELASIKKERWTNNTHNYYRAHLSMLFSELIEYEAIEYNVVEKIKKLPTLQKLRSILSDEERVLVDAQLRKNHYRYWVFINLFFHSGTRRREICTLKPKHINLEKQTYRCVVIKGGKYAEVERPIKDIAVPFWEIALMNCKEDEFIFSKGFTPGPESMRIDYVTRKWRRVVKDPPSKGGLGINVDLYSLKHLNTDEITDLLDIAAAAKLNSHSSTKVTLKHYAVNEHGRQMERIKRVGNTFAKSSDN